MSFAQLAGIPQKVTFPAGPTTQDVEAGQLNFPTPDGGFRFRIYEVPNLFNAVRDDVFYLGYNVTGTGGQDVAGENALWLGLEAHYKDGGGTEWMEWNMDYTPAAGGSALRFLGFSVNRATDAGGWSFLCNSATGISFKYIGNNTQQFNFAPSAAGTRIFVFRTAGGSGELFQFGYDGTSNAPDYISLSPSAQVDYKGFNVSRWGNWGLGMQAIAATGPAGILSIGNATTTSLGTPSGGGYLYVDAGALKFKGSSGTVTTVAPA